MEYQQQHQEPTYDPSLYYQSGGYYAYANQHPYPYYDPYAQPYNQSYRDHAPIHPPGVPCHHDQTHLQNHQDAYYQQPHAADGQQQQHLNSASGSAAVVVGNVEPTQMAVHHPQMQSAYRGGGRRGGRSFRGRGRGYHGPLTASHGRGRGRGGRHNHQGAESATLNSILVPTGSPASMPPSTSNPSNEQVLSNGHSGPPRQPPRMAWCELCRVECNTPEILEQHKNGKRHKKNLRLHEELQKLNQVKTGEQDLQLPKSESDVIQVQQCKEGRGKQSKEEIVPSAENNEKSKEIQPLAETSDNLKASTPNSAEPKGKSKDSLGSKRSSRGGHGGKFMRANDGRRRPIEHPKPKENIPLICELCNVKCESQVVFNTHLVGKKHLTHLKRFQGHRELYGDAGVQELYPSSLNASSSSFVPPVQQGVADPQVVLAQLLNYVVSQAQAQAQAHAQGQGQGQVQEQILPGLLAPLVAGLTASLAPAAAAPLPVIGTQSLHNPEAAQFQAISQSQTDNVNNNGNSESVPTNDAVVADAQTPSTTGTGLGNVNVPSG